MRLQYKPMVRYIWLGALIMALGGLIALSDRRYRRRKSTADEAVAASGTATAR
jgi:cytochrome c-type biogenesis protein CcmF